MCEKDERRLAAVQDGTLSFMRTLLLAGWAALAGCSSSDITVAPAADDSGADTTTIGTDAKTDGTTPSDTAIDAPPLDGPAPVDGGGPDTNADTTPAPTCSDPTTFPTFGKGCTLDSNCSFVLHQLDCCGSLGAIGINHAFVDDFNKTEDAYRKTCPVCDCLAKDTRTESGVSTNDATKIAVRCDVGLCKTYVK